MKKSSERVAAFRERMKRLGLSEVRHVWAYKQDHDKIRDIAKEVRADRERNNQ